MHLICQQCPLRRQVSYGWTRSIFFCFDFGVHVPILQLAGDVNLLPVRLSRAEFFFSSSSNFHHGSNAAALHCPPHRHRLAFRHLSAGRYSSARWSAHLNDEWGMSNTAPIFFFSPFQKMLTDTTKISL